MEGEGVEARRGTTHGELCLKFIFRPSYSLGQ